MSLSSALFAGISGLTTMGNAMSVLGDNVANVNTIAFKSSRSTFQNVLSQSVATAAGSAQIGRGVTLTTVDGLFVQGSFESTAVPTDMAIGGDGFFMLRAADSAEADMYTRAGEFRFNRQGYLTNPSGHFVQGWGVDAVTGQTQGTIGDINIGRSTPPVSSRQIDMIVNLDSRVPRETIEQRLFAAWNGTNVAAVNPSSPINSADFDYTTAIKVFDSKGAAHDVTIYFDRTAQENQWEFLVTVDPKTDLRKLSPAERQIYAPDERYNHERHPGAGALMYGVIDFNTAGAIVAISAWNVPPDGQVDPARNTNRITLGSTDNYYSFRANFTGADVDQAIKLNFGARYSGVPTNISQRLVSDKGAFADRDLATRANRETLFSSVHNFNGEPLFSATEATTISWGGFQNDGAAVTGGSFVVGTGDGRRRLQDFLTVLGNSFRATATLDRMGRIVLTDNTPGPSGMFVNSFTVTRGVPPRTLTSPFGDQINVTTTKREVISPGRATTGATGTPPVITAGTAWGTANIAHVFGNNNLLVRHGDTINFSGIRGDGALVAPTTYTLNLNATPPQTVQSFLDSVEAAFGADAFIDGAGRLVVRDRVADTVGRISPLRFQIDSYGPPATGSGAQVFGPALTNFETVAGSATEKGSWMGVRASRTFETEALSTTQYANSSTTIFQDQNGFAAGFLQSVSVDTSGIITGRYSNGQVLQRAQVTLANFSNLQGLHKVGGNVFRATTHSGAPVTGVPGANGLGSIAPNALEMSNVDLGTEFVKLITTQRGFQANSKIITTTDEMLNTLINIRR
ncbi:MAG: flagellar hook-basal body complex protein [Desulfobulbaceae bacterium]|nr:MAG: flagellar hook-basal body complex protein [Desulfobulbaceae bacterium]